MLAVRTNAKRSSRYPVCSLLLRTCGWLLVLFGPVAHNPVEAGGAKSLWTPCPSVYKSDYYSGSGQWYGWLLLNGISYGQAIHIKIDLVVSNTVTQNVVAKLMFTKTSEQYNHDIINHKKMTIRIDLSVKNQIPGLVAITLNGRKICTGKKYVGKKVSVSSSFAAKFVQKQNGRKANVNARPTQKAYSSNSNVNSKPAQNVYSRNANVYSKPTQNAYSSNSNVNSKPAQNVYSRNANVYSKPTQNAYSSNTNAYSQRTQNAYSSEANAYSKPTQNAYSSNRNAYSQPTQNAYSNNTNAYSQPTQNAYSSAYFQPTQDDYSSAYSQPTQNAYSSNYNDYSLPTQNANSYNGYRIQLTEDAYRSNANIYSQPAQTQGIVVSYETPRPVTYLAVTPQPVTIPLWQRQARLDELDSFVQAMTWPQATPSPGILPPTAMPPTTPPPVTQPPAISSSTILPPTTLTSETPSPATLPPTTLPPVTLPSTTTPSTTQPPTTSSSTTLAPTTPPPVTLAPATPSSTIPSPTTPTSESPSSAPMAPTTSLPATTSPPTLSSVQSLAPMIPSPVQTLLPEQPAHPSMNQSSVKEVIGCGKPTQVLSHLSINGNRTLKGQFPWASPIFEILASKPKYICGSTIITTTHLVTAAHCMYDTYGAERNPKGLLTVPGMYNIDDFFDADVQQRNVVKIFIHEVYTFEETGLSDSDIAVLKVHQPIVYNDLVRPICMWNEIDNQDRIFGLQGYVSGWGITESGESKYPNYVAATIVDSQACAKNLEMLIVGSPNLFCGDGQGSVPCTGDSGSGLVIKRGPKYTLRGVVSKGQFDPNTLTCARDKYIVYTDVAPRRYWLSQIVNGM